MYIVQSCPSDKDVRKCDCATGKNGRNGTDIELTDVSRQTWGGKVVLGCNNGDKLPKTISIHGSIVTSTAVNWLEEKKMGMGNFPGLSPPPQYSLTD